MTLNNCKDIHNMTLYIRFRLTQHKLTLRKNAGYFFKFQMLSQLMVGFFQLLITGLSLLMLIIMDKQQKPSISIIIFH